MEEVEIIYRNIRISVIEHRKRVEQLNSVNQVNRKYSIHIMQYEQSYNNLEVSIDSGGSSESVKRYRDNLARYFDSMKQSFLQLNEVTDAGSDVLSKVDILADISIPETISQQKRKEKAAMNLERVPLPKFDGNVRNIPRFLKDFETLVMRNLPKEQLSLALRQYSLESNKRNAFRYSSESPKVQRSATSNLEDPVKCIIHPNGSHQIYECFTFQSKSSSERMDMHEKWE